MTQSRQKQPSIVQGQEYPNQQPIIGVFGREPNDTYVPQPFGLGTGMQIKEETLTQELPEVHRRPFEEDKEIIEAETLLHIKREATDWKPITYTFDGKNPQQVARLIGRQTISFFNGSANVTIANNQTGVTNPSSNENFILTTGNSASIDTEGGFWLMAVAGTTISVVQTYYDLDAIALTKRRIKRHNGMTHSATDKVVVGTTK